MFGDLTVVVPVEFKKNAKKCPRLTTPSGFQSGHAPSKPVQVKEQGQDLEKVMFMSNCCECDGPEQKFGVEIWCLEKKIAKSSIQKGAENNRRG